MELHEGTLGQLSYSAFMASPHRSIKFTTYFPIYDELLTPFIGSDLTLVEVGVLDGGSLFMWRNLLGPGARIIGVDLNPMALRWEDHGFEVFIGDQADPTFWRDFADKVGQIDVLVDDGGHTFRQQVVTVESVLGQVRDGGLIIVEDTHTSYMSGFGPKKRSFLAYTKILMDRCNLRFFSGERTGSESAVWCVTVYESVVALRVDRRLAGKRSQMISNGASATGSYDHRLKGTLVQSVVDSSSRITWLRRTLDASPGLSSVARRARRATADLVARWEQAPPKDPFILK